MFSPLAQRTVSNQLVGWGLTALSTQFRSYRKATSGSQLLLIAGWPQFWGQIQGHFRDFQLPFQDLFQLCFTTLELRVFVA